MGTIVPVLLCLAAGLALSIGAAQEFPPPVGIAERVQDFRFASIGQGTNGAFSCATNWTAIRATNTFRLALLEDGVTCTNGQLPGQETNRLLLWCQETNPTRVWSTNVLLVATQYFTVLTSEPWVKPVPAPPPAVTNFLFTIYGSTNMRDWRMMTNFYVPNSQPAEFFRTELVPIVPR